ncbi:hypothetical protein B0H10DRAFT_1158746 [Mycena sp. CBHHK59/15]|nr:hypothetical protein B0H10DRAFT_1158746 [Mycena sp. CBHHK59/15]
MRVVHAMLCSLIAVKRVASKSSRRSDSPPIFQLKNTTNFDVTEAMPKRQDLDPGNPIKLAVKGEEHSVTTAGGGSLLVAPIIFPPGSNSPDHCDKKPIRGADLGLFQNHLPAGGCLVTIHDPLTASAWINLNYDHPLLRSLRDRQIGGPFAMMLSAHTEALVIFGPTDDPAILNMPNRWLNSRVLP